MFFLGAVLGVALAGGLGLYLGRTAAPPPEPPPPELPLLAPRAPLEGALQPAPHQPLLPAQPRPLPSR
jgi:hypothetical protein